MFMVASGEIAVSYVLCVVNMENDQCQQRSAALALAMLDFFLQEMPPRCRRSLSVYLSV